MKPADKTRLYPTVIAALLSARSIRAAARKVGMSVSSVERMMKEPEFSEQYQQAKCSLVQQATTQLTTNANDAALTLKKIFSDKKATAASRVSAAGMTLRLTLEAYELEQLETRIAKLEELSFNHASTL